MWQRRKNMPEASNPLEKQPRQQISRFTCCTLTPMSRKRTICANRYKSTCKTIKTAVFVRFAGVTLTGRQFRIFWPIRENFIIIIIIINLIKCKARFAIFQNREIFPGVTLVQCASMCFNSWYTKTETAHLIGCQHGFFKIRSKWFPL